MKVKDIIKELLDYNLDAELSIVIDGLSHNNITFGYGCGDGEGVSKTNTSSVSINVYKKTENKNISNSIEECKTFEELNRFIDASEIFGKNFNDYRNIYDNEDKQTQQSLDDFIKICKNYITISEKTNSIKTHKIRKGTHVMELMYFIEYVDNGYFIDDDGFGYLATKDLETDIEIEPSTIHEVSGDHIEFKYVTWYNK